MKILLCYVLIAIGERGPVRENPRARRARVDDDKKAATCARLEVADGGKFADIVPTVFQKCSICVRVFDGTCRKEHNILLYTVCPARPDGGVSWNFRLDTSTFRALRGLRDNDDYTDNGKITS